MKKSMNKIEEVPKKKITRNRWHKMKTHLPRKICKLIEGNFIDSKNYKNRSRALLIIDRIYYDYVYDKIPLDDPKKIPSNYVQDVIGSKYYKPVWTKLKNLGVFKVHENYSTSARRSFSLLWNQELVNSNIIEVNYLHTLKFTDDYLKLIIKSFERVDLRLPYSAEETVRRRIPEIEEEVRKRITEQNGVFRYINKKNKVRIIRGEVEEFIQNKVNLISKHELNSLTKILDKNWIVKRNNTNNRLTTNYVQLGKAYLKYLYIDGKPVKQIDLSNSQFTIFANFICSVLPRAKDINSLTAKLIKLNNRPIPHQSTIYDYRYGNNDPLKNLKLVPNIKLELDNLTHSHISNTLYSIRNNFYYKLFNFSSTGFDFLYFLKMFCLNKNCAENPDLWEFVDSSLKGKLYDILVERLDLPDRDTAKIYSFKLFFGPIYRWDKKQKKLVRTKDRKYKRILREYYPTVIEMIDCYKEYCTDKEKIEFDKMGWGAYSEKYGKSYWRVAYSKFSVMLQEFESLIFIDKTYNPILFDKQCILSRHDSFVFAEEDHYTYFEKSIRKYLKYGAEFSAG